MMREGWICPRCQLALAPHINFCDCRDKGGDAGIPAVPVSPGPSSDTGVLTWPTGGSQIVTSETGWTITNVPTVFQGNTTLGHLATVRDAA